MRTGRQGGCKTPTAGTWSRPRGQTPAQGSLTGRASLQTHTHRHTHRYTHRHTYTHTHRQIHTDTHRYTHTHTHTQDLWADADSINSLMLIKTGYRTVYSLYECLSKGYTPIDTSFKRFPDSSDGRVYPQCWRPGFDPSVGKNPWRRKWQPIPIFLPGKSHGWRSLVG